MHRILASFTHRVASLRPAAAAWGRLHAWVLRRSGGRVGGRWFGAPVLVLVTVGRRTGRVRETPLLYVEVEDAGAGAGALALLAANAGNDRPPAWWLNLRAAETVEVLVRGRCRRMRWREAEGEEREALMAAFVRGYPAAGHYAELTDRVLPVVVLVPA